jgi:hypothetical protein
MAPEKQDLLNHLRCIDAILGYFESQANSPFDVSAIRAHYEQVRKMFRFEPNLDACRVAMGFLDLLITSELRNAS